MTERTVPLSSGTPMPLVGLGTWQLRGGQCRDAVATALEAGYRHLDTATMYGNEAEVGAGVRDSGVDRDEVFLTTKLPPDRADAPRDTLRASLDALGTSYIDLWLIHWPPNGAGVDVWREFIAAAEDGLARAIGVSNYSTAQIDELATATGVTPAVNQVKWSPALFDPARLTEHRERGVVLEGYSPFKAGGLDADAVRQVADKHGRTPAQVVVRWHVQHGIVVIPKSARPERIRANVDVWDFTLDDEDMTALDGLAGS